MLSFQVYFTAETTILCSTGLWGCCTVLTPQQNNNHLQKFNSACLQKTILAGLLDIYIIPKRDEGGLKILS